MTLLHSAVCDAVWGELVRLDGRLDGRVITIEVFPLDDRYGGRSSRATATGASAVNTRMLLGSSRLEGVCAVVTVAPTTGETSTTEAPLCV
ncbi:hypothetical protein [Microbacterium sp. 18062]|uniref:hypothetical protein n=1 Tax=Microbacterium sp. 18062 TaxID=2681410 RepID=UPI001358C1E0|nr:hypothetical protein [Microbacterium sp. 18062]